MNLTKFHKYIMNNPTSSDKKIIKLTKMIQREKDLDKEIYKNIDSLTSEGDKE